MAPRWNVGNGELEMAWPEGLIYRIPIQRWRVNSDNVVEWFDADGSETIRCNKAPVFVRFIGESH